MRLGISSDGDAITIVSETKQEREKLEVFLKQKRSDKLIPVSFYIRTVDYDRNVQITFEFNDDKKENEFWYPDIPCKIDDRLQRVDNAFSKIREQFEIIVEEVRQVRIENCTIVEGG